MNAYMEEELEKVKRVELEKVLLSQVEKNLRK